MANIHQIREISTLSFNERVLQEAEDRSNPLLERVKFLGIFSSNMDELFKVRVASIHRRIELGKDNMHDVLDEIADKSRELDERFRAAYVEIMAALEREGIRIVSESQLVDFSPEVLAGLHSYFKEEVLPSLVPIILSKDRPFPPLTDSSIYFGIVMSGEKSRFAILEIPQLLPRFVTLADGNFIYMDDVIRRYLHDLFYIFTYDTVAAYEFKISRDAELDIDNDFSEGHVRKMERVLRQRKKGRPTRLVYDAEMPRDLLKILMKELHITEDDTLIPGGRYHNMKDLMRFPAKKPALCFPKMDPVPHPVLDQDRTPTFELVKKQDILVTYPYQSFDHLTRFLREAAIDPKVEAIKMTLYRAAKNSQVVNALVNAARNGKRVHVNIELNARFDEENNIRISERLKDADAQVTYGIPPMKVHAKLLFVERKGGDFAGLSTGNFNESTGDLYVDSLLLTQDKRLVSEVDQVFRYLDNASRMLAMEKPSFKHLLVSPFNSRKLFMKYIAREKAKGEDGYICMKINHLTDAKLVKAVLAAANAGVRMDLIVRTTYAVPEHPNIRAISILDRYLEHQRAYIFGEGEGRMVFMSSADLMERNLDWRVECAFPIYDEALQQEVVDLIQLQIHDTCKARILDATQSNAYVDDRHGGLRAQTATYAYYLERWKHSQQPIET